MILKFFGLLIISTSIITAEYQEKTDNHVDYFAPAEYTYSYGVEDFKTGDYKMHKEVRNGDVVKGEYRIADPDGSIRTVTYTADKEHGFQAIVKQSKPFVDSHKMNTHHDTEDFLEQNQESSSKYEPHSYGSTVQPNNNDFKKQSIFKYTPLVSEGNKFSRFTENYNQMIEEKKEMNPDNHHDNPRNLKTQSKKYEHNKDNLFLNKKQQLQDTYVSYDNMKQVEAIKDLSKKIKPIFGTKITQNEDYVASHVGEHKYKPKELYYAPPLIQIPKVEINGKLYKNSMNTQQNIGTQLYYIPVHHQGNNQNNIEHNTNKPSVILRENYLDSKETTLIEPKEDFVQDSKQDFQELFYRSQYFNKQNEDIFKHVDNKQAISYQIDSTKSQDIVKGQHQSSIESQSKPFIPYTPQQKGNKKSAISYQSITNGKNDEGDENNQIRPLYQKHMDTIRAQRNMETENNGFKHIRLTLPELTTNLQKQTRNRMVKIPQPPSKEQLKYPEYVNKQYKMLSDYIQPNDLRKYFLPNYESYIIDDGFKYVHQIQDYKQ